jgi:hypothetical protein
VTTSFSNDLLPSINAIAEYMYGEANPRTVRRVRHMIDRGLPAKKAAGRLESRKTWIDGWYAEPDPELAKLAKREGA